MNSAILLASGGLDSTTLAHEMVEKGIDVHPVFFDYVQHCAEKEWDTLRQVMPDATQMPERVNVSDVFKSSRSRLIKEADLWHEHVESEDLYIPYRTLLFFTLGAAIAQTKGILAVYSAFINSNYVVEVDCSSDFFNKLDALAEGVGPVRLILPYRELTKFDVARRAIDLKVAIGKTFSCQVFSTTPCGACPNCYERMTALSQVVLK